MRATGWGTPILGAPEAFVRNCGSIPGTALLALVQVGHFDPRDRAAHLDLRNG